MSGRRVGFEPYLLDLAPEKERTLYVGINGTLNFSRVLLPILGGVFIDLTGFTFTFLLTVGIMLFAFIQNVINICANGRYLVSSYA